VNQFSKKVQVDEDLVKAMAAINKGDVSFQPIGKKSGASNRGEVSDECRAIGKPSFLQSVPADIVERARLIGIDDDVRCLRPRRRAQRLANGERRGPAIVELVVGG